MRRVIEKKKAYTSDLERKMGKNREFWDGKEDTEGGKRINYH